MPMRSNACSWSKCKWLLLALPLALSGCGNEEADQARELQTRMDEAQVRIEAQAARIASLERNLAAAIMSSRQAEARRRAAGKEQLARRQQLKVLQQQRQALLLDQRNLRQALATSNATRHRINQQLLFVGQQNRFLQQRISTLDLWLRQQAAVVQGQYRELATLRAARPQAAIPRQELDTNIADREARLTRMEQNRNPAADKLRLLNENLATAIDNGRRLSAKIEQLQRARAYLADKLAASEKRLAELQKSRR